MKTLILLALLGMATPVFAQSAEQLKRENEALRAQLAQQKEQPLTVTVESVRKKEQRTGVSHLIITLKVKNNTSEAMALNLLSRSQAMHLVDNYGNKFSPTQAYGKITGIPVASTVRAFSTPNLPPGGSMNITIHATGNLYGAKMGETFDLNMTLGQFANNGRGQIEKVREFPVSFVGQPIGGGGVPQAVDNAVENAVGRTVDRLLKKL